MPKREWGRCLQCNGKRKYLPDDDHFCRPCEERVTRIAEKTIRRVYAEEKGKAS